MLYVHLLFLLNLKSCFLFQIQGRRCTWSTDASDHAWFPSQSRGHRQTRGFGWKSLIFRHQKKPLWVFNLIELWKILLSCPADLVKIKHKSNFSLFGTMDWKPWFVQPSFSKIAVFPIPARDVKITVPMGRILAELLFKPSSVILRWLDSK